MSDRTAAPAARALAHVPDAVAVSGRILLAAPQWYDCAAALARLTALFTGAGVAAETMEPVRLDAAMWPAPGALPVHGLILHPSAEDYTTAAARRGTPPAAAIADWTHHTAALLAQCARIARLTVLDPHAVLDDDRLADSLGAHLGLTLTGDATPPARSRDEDASAAVTRYLCRLAVMETPEVGELAAALAPRVLSLWSAPPAAGIGDALATHATLAAGTGHGGGVDPVVHAALAHRLAEAEAQIALLVEQIVPLQEAVGAAIFDSATLQHQTIYAEDGLTHPAFYPPERRPADGRPLRWIGREDDAVVATDISRTRPVRVDVEIAVTISQAALKGFSVSVDGKAPLSVEVVRLDDGSWRQSSTFAPPAAPDPLALTRVGLHIAAKTDLTSRGDPRALAVGIHKIDVWQIEGDTGSGTVEIAAADLTAPAFYDLERHPSGAAFRWMGREEAATHALAASLPERVSAVVEMPLAISQRAVDGFALTLGGTAATAAKVEASADGRLTKTFTFAGVAGADSLGLTLAERVAEGGADGRMLGVAIARIVLRPA
ncbi:hypothetical protein ATO13_03190 [Stappia sp. 22II-S9-Z10]|nr:hypothetical protein ATO13_03190 [Stappia sp. 22II-S9-Z10]